MAEGDALIGHTGFVGSNLLRARVFAATFNSRTIGEIDHRHFDNVVCAGVSAVKWWANQNPDQDRARIEGLMAHLRTIRAHHFTLISTVDVYDPPLGANEHDIPIPARLHAYGRNRVLLERFVAEQFAAHQIVRLPALFGAGLKKNALYDLMHDNRTEVINPASSFQWYPLDRLAGDLRITRAHGLDRINLATAPLRMEEIRQRCFAGSRIGAEAAAAVHYDMRTIHGALFGARGFYVLEAPSVLEAIERFVAGGTGP